MLGALFGVSVFHDSGLDEDAGLESNNLHLDFGNGTKDDIQKELNSRINKAENFGLSPKGLRTLVVVYRAGINCKAAFASLQLGTRRGDILPLRDEDSVVTVSLVSENSRHQLMTMTTRSS